MRCNELGSEGVNLIVLTRSLIIEQQDCKFMSHYKTDTNGTMITTAPLFSSVWLALFHVLRKNFNQRRLEAAANIASPQDSEE